MKTPNINLDAGASFLLRFHDTSGTSRQVQARGDGQVEGEIVGVLHSSGSPERFVSSLDDPRLSSADPFTELARSGWRQRYDHWVPDGFSMSCPASSGAGQEIVVQRGSDGVQTISLSSSAGGLEHRLSATSKEGHRLSQRESLVLDASPAGLPVFQDDQVLFDLPSAYTGGCTI